MANSLLSATFSKSPKFFGKDFEPGEVAEGHGATVVGSDGRRYLDWISGLGATLLGYPLCAPGSYAPANLWANRIAGEVRSGAGFSLPHRLERQVAKKLVGLLSAHVSGWQGQSLGVRFGLSGTDATTMAVRLARAVTGRDQVISVGYHGWSDWSVSTTPPAWGIPSGMAVDGVPFGNSEALYEAITRYERYISGASCVIIEQPAQDPPSGYWQEVRRLCTEHGALLILDEVVTGLRFALGGAAELYGIEPDIVCMGKALGNGIPISCMVGRREYFDWFSRSDPCFVSSTGFGNSVALAAADSVLDSWSQQGVDHLWRLGRILMDGFTGLGYGVIGQAPRFLVQHPTLHERAYFILRLRDAGILANRPWLVNWAHSESDVKRTLVVAASIKEEMARIDVVEEMKGRLPSVLFENR